MSFKELLVTIVCILSLGWLFAERKSFIENKNLAKLTRLERNRAFRDYRATMQVQEDMRLKGLLVLK